MRNATFSLYILLLKDPLEQFSIFSMFGYLNNFIIVLCCFLSFLYFFEKAICSLQITYVFLFLSLKFKILFFIIKMNALRINKFIYLPVLTVLYALILFFNVVGMLPFFFTITSLFIVTFIFSFGVWFGVLIIGILEQKEKFWLLFLPPNSPKYLYFFLIFIEIISYVARLFSLSVRLFANMTAGHLLLKILAGVCYQLTFLNPYIFCFVPGLVVALIIVLEFVVALIQAGIFIGLSSIYIGNSLVSH